MHFRRLAKKDNTRRKEGFVRKGWFGLWVSVSEAVGTVDIWSSGTSESSHILGLSNR